MTVVCTYVGGIKGKDNDKGRIRRVMPYDVPLNHSTITEFGGSIPYRDESNLRCESFYLSPCPN